MFLVDCWKQHAFFIHLYIGATCIRIYENYIDDKQCYKYKKDWNFGFSKPNTQTLKQKELGLSEWRQHYTSWNNKKQKSSNNWGIEWTWYVHFL